MKKGFIIVLASVVLSGITAWGIVKAQEPALAGTQVQAGAASDGQLVKTVNLSLSDYPDFTYAAENSVKAVVYVEVTSKAPQQEYIDPFFRFFFGDGMGGGGSRERKGSGSGVIIREDGYIVTNNHVVANATNVTVTLNNNKKYTAKVIGTDPATDVALIKIDATGLPVLQFADSDRLRLGEWVLAIGSPLGEQLRSTITAGIVSAKGRSMSSGGEFKIESFIQTDAAVNPGNSGGALVNKSGELVGINTAIVSTTGSYSGYSFAIPSNIVHKIVADLIDFGSVKRAKLGVSITAINEEMAEKMKLSSLEGVYIAEVVKGGSADKAGIKAEDIIIAIDSTKTATPQALQEKVNAFHPGDKAEVELIRGGKTLKLQVVFQDEESLVAAQNADGTVVFYGATLKAAKKGVEIVSAGNGKIAEAGGEDGFIIMYVNDKKVSKPKDVIDIAKKSNGAVFIEGVTASGRPGYFGFGKDQ